MYLPRVKSFFPICLFLLVSLTTTLSTARADNPLSYLREKYDEMPEKGKFAAGAAAGFVGSRIAVKSAVTVVKVAGAAYIATEVMNAAGVLDEVKTGFYSERQEMIEEIKLKVLKKADEFRTTVRRRLNPDKIKDLYESDRMATMGVATGAFLGFLL